jgi:flagellar M-ring protein FliF
MGVNVDGLLKAITSLGPARLFGALGVTAVVAAALFALVFRVGGEEKALLFADVSMAEASEIANRLDQAAIAYELRGDGTTIFVPRSKVLSARLMLSEEGLPSQGSVGYEIFDRQDALGATQFQQNINRLRALEGELARTIASIRGVERARVHLVLPEKRLFERSEQKPSASIVLKTSGAPLTQGQVRAIRNLVSSAVPDLPTGRVTVADDTGRLLAAADDDSGAAAAEAIEERTTSLEQRMKDQVLSIVESVVGPGAARVQVKADVDFNRITETSQTFDPDGRVVRESSSIEDSSEETENASNGAATAGRNLPDGAGEDGENVRGAQTERTEESVRYEISNTTKTEIVEGGRVRRLSVAVAVDGVTTPPAAEGGEPTWAPRPQEELDQIAALVRSTVGFDEARGDTIEVVNLRFAPSPTLGTEVGAPGLLSFDSDDIMRGAEIAAALVAGLAIVIFVLRPLASGLVRGGTGARALEFPGAVVSGGGALTGAVPVSLGEEGPLDEHIEIARIQGQVKASSVKRVSDLIKENPDESAQIIRTWLADGA